MAMRMRTNLTSSKENQHNMRITDLLQRVTSRAWMTRDVLRDRICEGYRANFDQGEALLKIGLLNKFIQHDRDTDMYRITEQQNEEIHRQPR